MQIRNRFDPNQKGFNIPKAIADCLKAQDGCYGLSIKLSSSHEKRIGSAFLDVFYFKRESMEKSWHFDGLFVVKNKKVVYKIWEGSPNEESYKKTVRPLGPLQSLSDIIALTIPL